MDGDASSQKSVYSNLAYHVPDIQVDMVQNKKRDESNPFNRKRLPQQSIVDLNLVSSLVSASAIHS